MATNEIRTEPLTSANLPEAASLWPDRVGYSTAEFGRALGAATTLLREQRAIGTVFRVGSVARAFGMSAFVRSQFADEYLQEPHPQVGKRLLLETAASRSPVLSHKEVGRGNAEGGLDLIVVGTHIAARANADRWELFGTLLQSFIQVHAGYRLRRIINEVFGDADVADVRAAGVFTVAAEFDGIGAGSLKSLVATLTIEEAVERRSTLLPMFLYRPPRLHLNATEQELLRAALEGGTDEALAAKCGVSLSGIKARWTRIQQKASRHLAEPSEHMRPRRNGRGRGAQTRHILLRYVRNNPSELTPYSHS